MPIAVAEPLSLPAGIHELDGFRRWSRSRAFPETGRIDFVAGSLEIDRSPEDLYTHGAVKAEIAAELQLLVSRPGLGSVFVDRTRVSCAPAALSAEPDVVVVFWESIDAGRVQEIPAVSDRPGRYVELEGAPDLVVEILSDASEKKDLKVLPGRYAAAGVPELWLIDARGKSLRFNVRTLQDGVYRPVSPSLGWLRSPVLGRSFRLERREVRSGRWSYRLEHRG
jgi:Uma2 family endonuclease